MPDSTLRSTHRTAMRELTPIVARRLALATLLALVSCGKDGSPPKADPDRKADAPDSAEAKPSSEEQPVTDGPVRVTLSAAATTTARIAVESVRAEAATAASSGLDVPGQVDYDPSRVAIISPRTKGRVERLLVVEGTRVSAGQPVALLVSGDYLTAQSDLQQAARRAALLAGSADAEGANALVNAARRRLRFLGASDALIRRVERGSEPEPYLPVLAPFAGTIVESQSLAGSSVEPGAALFRIADLTAVDVIAQVPERALSFLKVGQGASIGIAAYPSMRFTGRIERIKTELDPTTRSVQAVLHVTNTGGALRPGMFASVRLHVALAQAAGAGSAPTSQPRSASVLTIPDAAVLSDGDLRYVFIEIKPNTYERRVVQITSTAPAGAATATSGRVIVLAGLRVGERVVVSGAFTLRSELAKAALSEE